MPDNTITLSPDKLEQLYKTLHDTLKEISKARMVAHSKKDNVTLEVLPETGDMSYDHWVSLVMVGFPGIKISFQCHFTTKISRDLTAGVIDPSTPITPESCHSFFTEYCNLVGGGIKNALTDAISKHFFTPKVGDTMLPKKTASFDTFQNVKSGLRQSVWKLSLGIGDVVCTSDIDISEDEITKHYQGNIEKLVQGITCFEVCDTGEVTFL